MNDTIEVDRGDLVKVMFYMSEDELPMQAKRSAQRLKDDLWA